MNADRTSPTVTYLLSVTYVIVWNIATPFIPLYLTAHGATPTTVGLVVSLSGLLPLLFAVHVGALVDVHGPAPVGKWSVAVEAIACAILVAFPSATGVAVGYALLGLGNLGLTVATQIVVAESSSPAQRARNYGYYSSWISAGMVLGPIVGGALVDAWGYPAVFVSVLALMIPSFVLAALVKPRARASSPAAMECGLVPTRLFPCHGRGRVRRRRSVVRHPLLRSLVCVGLPCLGFSWHGPS